MVVTDSQKKIFLLAQVTIIGLIIRSADPFGWSIRVNKTVIQLCYDLGTAAIFSIV